MRVTIGMRAAVRLLLALPPFWLSVWPVAAQDTTTLINRARAECRADMRVLKISQLAPVRRCFAAKARPIYRQKFGPALFATFDVYLARTIEIADRLDRGLITDAQAALEEALASKEQNDDAEAHFRVRDQTIERQHQDRMDAIHRRYSGPSNSWLCPSADLHGRRGDRRSWVQAV